MRFSYIDSQGKEIEVDSVESLALRIQLGAIKPDTRMYDAVADRWAPAEEHPVYRSLSRGEEIDEEEVVAIGQDVAAAEPEGREPEDATDLDGPAEATEAAEAETSEEVVEEAADTDEETPGVPSDEDPLGLDFPVSVTDHEPEGDAESPPDQTVVDEAARESAGLESEAAGVGPEPTEAGPSEDETEEDEPEAAEPEEAGPPEDETEEDEPEEAEPEEAGPPEDETEEDEPESPRPAWLDEGEALWQKPQDTGAGERDESGATTHRDALEEDLADPRRKMPEWAAGPPEVEEWEERVEEEEPAPPEETRGAPHVKRPVDSAPPRRPVHWDERRRAKGRRSRSVRLAQAAGLVLIVGAAAGYFLIGPGEPPETGESAEEIAEPSVPPGQWTAMATAADRAWSDVLDEFQSGIPGYGLPYRPPEAWLNGIYLSNASDYPDVVEYWNGVAETVESLRARESALYFQYLNQHLERMAAGPGDGVGASPSVTAGAVPRLVSLGREEYERSAPARNAAYQQIRDLARASLALHDLLVTREDDIFYEPYSDPEVSRDPVLEAVPADSLLRTEMNEALDQVIAAITENDIPRPITTSALFNHLLTELARTEPASETPPPPGPPEA